MLITGILRDGIGSDEQDMMNNPAIGVLLQSSGDWPGVEGSILLLGVILLAGLGTGILFIISINSYKQRRSTRYLLITIAVGALFFRSIVGIVTVAGVVPMTLHHLIEHSLDFIIASLILYAVLRSKPSQLEPTIDDI